MEMEVVRYRSWVEKKAPGKILPTERRNAATIGVENERVLSRGNRWIRRFPQN
jgi:hypothetical protein